MTFAINLFTKIVDSLRKNLSIQLNFSAVLINGNSITHTAVKFFSPIYFANKNCNLNDKQQWLANPCKLRARQPVDEFNVKVGQQNIFARAIWKILADYSFCY